MEPQPEIKVITMKARGLESDVRLHVLDRAVFEVHSIILKLQSQFFFKFLEPVNKEDTASTATHGATKYEWITEWDDNGMDWYLVSGKYDKVFLCNSFEIIITNVISQQRDHKYSLTQSNNRVTLSRVE